MLFSLKGLPFRVTHTGEIHVLVPRSTDDCTVFPSDRLALEWLFDMAVRDLYTTKDFNIWAGGESRSVGGPVRNGLSSLHTWRTFSEAASGFIITLNPKTEKWKAKPRRAGCVEAKSFSAMLDASNTFLHSVQSHFRMRVLRKSCISPACLHLLHMSVAASHFDAHYSQQSYVFGVQQHLP